MVFLLKMFQSFREEWRIVICQPPDQETLSAATNFSFIR